jgi:hypothetical protein
MRFTAGIGSETVNGFSGRTWSGALSLTGRLPGNGPLELQALAQRRAWQAARIFAPRIAVNILAVQLQQPDFVDRVLDIVSAESGIVDFEITESVLMHSIEDNIQKLQRLRNAGISIAIDDFGIGYSSLSYPTRLPVNTVKVDRAFVSKMTTDPQGMAVVCAIITLSRALRLKTSYRAISSASLPVLRISGDCSPPRSEASSAPSRIRRSMSDTLCLSPTGRHSSLCIPKAARHPWISGTG